MDFHIDYTALVVAAVAKSVIGAIWYSPILFGKQWASLAGVRAPAKADMAKPIVGELIGNFIIAYVLVHILHHVNAHDWQMGAMVGFWVWLGFVATFGFSAVLWEKKPVKLYAINIGNALLSLAAMGAILAMWH